MENPERQKKKPAIRDKGEIVLSQGIVTLLYQVHPSLVRE